MSNCRECDGWGWFYTINKDGRFGPLYPRILECPECGGTGNVDRDPPSLEHLSDDMEAPGA